MGEVDGTSAHPPSHPSTDLSSLSSPMQLCLIMDEVDGMSAGDRGGVADLIQVGAGGRGCRWDVGRWACVNVGRGTGRAGACALRCQLPGSQRGTPRPHLPLRPAPPVVARRPSSGRACPSSVHLQQHSLITPHACFHFASPQTIKRTRVPIIAICNDKYSQKLKSLRGHTLELEYHK